MSISFTNYVDISSGVAGGGVVRNRELITRVFSENPLIPANSFAEFESAADVGTYFGTSSVEYQRAAYYFSFVSKSNLQPQKISFASWVNNARAATIYGDGGATATLAQLNAITNGSLNLTLGSNTHTLTGISFAAAGSFAAVAAALQTLIQAYTAGGAAWTAATVVYNATGPLGANFQITSGTTGAGSIAALPVTGEADVGAALGWESALAVVSQGSAAMTLTATMIASTAASNNFATFCYVPTLDEAQILELATWQATTNISYMGEYQVTANDAAAVSEAIISLPGAAMTLVGPNATDFPEMIPGMILAATDYSKPNASQSYMYQQVPSTFSTVTDDADQEAYDLLRVNYYGQTQTAGQAISFYQRGILTGLATSPSDMNVYANEIWLKDFIGDSFMSLLLSENEIPANASGLATGLSVLDSCIPQAISNGVISVATQPGLTQAQIASITALSGSQTAWRQVAQIGYWRTASFSSYVTEDGRTEYQFNYTLIYTKNNAIRKVVGTHNLI